MRNVKFFIAAILFLGISASSWGTTIASWGKISISASTDYKATGGDANNNNTAKFSSSKDFTAGSGTYAYYGGSAYGAVITFSSLTLTSYRNIKISFYSRASKGKAWQIKYSPDGTNWYSHTGPNTNAMTGSETLWTVEGIPPTATHLKLIHLGTEGSLYFGTITIYGDGEGECSDGMLSKGVAAGDEIVIYDDTGSKEWDGLSSGYSGVSSFTTKPNGAYTFIVEAGATPNANYSLKHGDQYLSMSSKAANTLTLSSTKNAASSWTISIDNNGVAKIQNSSYTDYYIKYNSSTPRFSSYTSNASSTRYPKIAHFCPSAYHVTYNPNGATSGSVPVDNNSYDPAGTDPATVLGNTGGLVKTGYSFGGWNTNPTGTGSNYTAGDQFYVTDNITLYAKWTPNPYTITLNDQSADAGKGGTGSISVTYDASTNLTGTPAITVPQKTGYTFGGYYTDEGGIGTQIIAANGNVNASAGGGSTYTNASKQWKYAGNITLYAKWTQTVDLLKNTGSSDGSVTVTYNVAGTASFSAAVKAGWTCTGYWTTSSGGYKVIEADGTLAEYSSNISSYINSDGKWIHTGATELYAQWEANLYTVTFYKNDLSATGSMDAQLFEYGTAQNLSTCTFERTGYSFVGWATTSSGDKAYDDGEEVNNLTTTPDGNVDLFALWSINSYTLTVGTPNNVTITAEPDGGSEMEEGDDDDVEYNTTITLAYTGMTSGYFWGGWRVSDGSGNDITEDVMYDENTMFMPASNATVTALLYTNAKAWCPVITLELSDGSTPILVTSVGGQSVKAVRTLHLTVTGAPSNASRVEISGDDLEFYDGTTLINNSTNKLTCTDNALDKTITVAYAPSAYVDESWANPTITVECYTAASEGIVAADIEVEDLVNARCLPDNGTSSGQGFVIAAKVDGEWLALPSAMSAGAQDGLPISVDYNDDPQMATLAPSSARYNLYNVYKSSSVNDRHKLYGDYAYLAGRGSKVLKSASSGTNISLGVNASTYSGGSADAAYFEWLLSTTDKINYTLTNNGRSAQLKYYTTHDKFGMYSSGSQVITEFRLLPATFYEEAPMQVIEWKANSVVVMYTGSETTATTKVGTNSASSSQTLANNKLTHGIYELTTDQALTSNDGAELEISFGDGSTRKIVEVPIIITGNSTATDGHAAQDVVICDGGKLTAATTSYDYYNVYVYGGGKLDIPSGKALGVNNIILRAGGLSTSGIGSSPSATYQYVYPQVGLIGTLTSAEANIQYEYITDYDHWYHFCLPFDGTLSTIHYPMEYYGDNVTEDNTGSWIVKRYAGEIRATGNYNAWVNIENESATAVTAGHGYIFWGAPKKVSVGGAAKLRQQWGIQRIAMPIADFSTAAAAEAANKSVGDLSSYSSVPGNSGQINDQGWNLIGNPYLVNLSGLTSTTSLKTGKLIHVDDAGGNWTGRWESNGDSHRYITVPSEHFDTYEARALSYFDGTTLEKTLQAGQTFFVQMDGENTAVQFAASDRKAMMPALLASAATDVETGILMSDDTHSDEVNFWVKDGKTADYEQNADYPKTMNQTNFNIYGVHEVGNLSWVAIGPEVAEGEMPIGFQVPAAGDYLLSLSESYGITDLEHVYVTDHQMNPEVTVDLLYDAYEFHVNNAETNNTRFTVSILLKSQTPDNPDDPGTGLEDVRWLMNKSMKFIYQDNLYIIRNGVIYDATGKRVREINK